MDYKREATIAALALDGMVLEDFESTVFVVVGGEILADSETKESAEELVKKARSYGEDAFYYEYEAD